MSSQLTSDVLSFLRRYGLENQPMVVAVSGGIDSVTMLHVLAELQRPCNLELHVVHIDHGLRPDSIEDANFVQRIAGERQLPFHGHRVHVLTYAEEHGSGIEFAARELRYRALQETAAKVGAAVVLTAHTADDNVETILMHVARAGTIKAIAGIPTVRPLSETLSVYRPFLEHPRSEIQEHATQQGIVWIDDPTNSEPIYLRNRVRNEVIPVLGRVFGPQVGSNIRSVATMMADVSSLMAELVDRAAIQTRVVDAGQVQIDDALWVRLHPAVMTELLRTRYSCTHADVDRLFELRHADAGTKASLSLRRVGVRERSAIIIGPAERPIATETSDEIEASLQGEYASPCGRLHTELCSRFDVADASDVDGANHVVFDQSSLVGRLLWRVWQPGDRLQPLGMHGTKLVSDLLTEAKIDHTKRRQARVLADEEGILWVCGVRRSSRALITDDTTRILRCRFLSE